MYCPKCGTPNSETARFCEKCGMPLAVASPGPGAAVGTGPVAGVPAPAPVPQAGFPPPPPSQQPWQPPQPGAYADPRMRALVPYTNVQAGQRLATGKDPVVALLLSLFLPAIGQFYNGDAKKGAAMLGGYVVSAILWTVVIGYVGTLGIWIWSMIDAYNVASGKTPLW